MNISAIIGEYNPFHNGHAYHILKTRKSGSTHIISIMSGDFAQRADVCIVSKYKKAEMALNAGVDLVIELPLPYSISAAQKFAHCAVSIADSLNCVDSLSFGSECGDINLLKRVSTYIDSEKTDINIKKYLKEGFSFSKARSLAISDLYGDEISNILNLPNNILAIEYIRALNNINSTIKPITFRRILTNHDSDYAHDNFASASYIRNLIYNNMDFNLFIPKSCAKILNEQINLKNAPADIKKLEVAILAKLRTMSIEKLANIPDVNEGLEYRLYDAIRKSTSLDDLYDNTKTKRYTHARIRRIVLYAFLGITKSDLDIPAPYIRVLGFNNKGKEILKIMKNRCNMPIVIQKSDIDHLGDTAKYFWDLECKASDLFYLSTPKIGICGLNMLNKPIILD